ncbi:hypothetical protein [Streptomyces antibioticus]|uniref:hypothetical protein n=1 Tax=Streptomyces antibioticus TaxID=1890 RepID=UPI003D756950
MAEAARATGLSLASKLLILLRLRRDTEGYIPSARDVSAASSPAGSRPSISHTQANDLLNGRNANPTSVTITALAGALDAPAAFLLPGWDDLAALTTFQNHPEAREVLRLMQGLEVQDIAGIVEDLREVRRRHGLPEHVPEIPTPPPGVDQPRKGRPRRLLSFAEAAARAVDDLEGR